MDDLDGFCPISDLRPATDACLGSLVLRCWEDLEGLSQLGPPAWPAGPGLLSNGNMVSVPKEHDLSLWVS